MQTSPSESDRQQKPPTVLVWKQDWLPLSETFIHNQVASFRRWNVVKAGLFKVESILASDDDIILLDSSWRGRFAQRVLALTGRGRHLERFLRGLEPTLIHAHFAASAFMIFPLARRLGIPLVVTLHGIDITAAPRRGGLRGWWYRLWLRRLFSDAELIVAVSGFIAQEAMKHGALSHKVLVHHIGVPLEPLRGPVPPEWDVLFVGRLVEKKGVADLIEALHLIPRPMLPRGVAIVGAGPLEVQLKNLALERDLPISFLGSQPPDFVRNIMAKSRVFAAPSKQAPNGDSEGFGMVFLEAAAAAIPTAAYKHGGVVEAVLDGETGLLADEGDVAGLARNLVSLLSDESLRQRLGRRARDRVERDFDVLTQTGTLEELYDDIVARRAASDSRV